MYRIRRLGYIKHQITGANQKRGRLSTTSASLASSCFFCFVLFNPTDVSTPNRTSTRRTSIGLGKLYKEGLGRGSWVSKHKGMEYHTKPPDRERDSTEPPRQVNWFPVKRTTTVLTCDYANRVVKAPSLLTDRTRTRALSSRRETTIERERERERKDRSTDPTRSGSRPMMCLCV